MTTAADQGVASALEAVLSDNARRVYGAQWRLFTDWCGDVGLMALPVEPLTGGPLPGRPRQHCHPPPGHLRHRQGRLSRVNWEFFSGHSGRVGAAVPVSYPPPQPKTA